MPGNSVHIVRTAFRTVLRGRASFFAISVLALAIGISTAIFSLAYAVIFHALPFSNQQALRVLWKRDLKSGVPFLELAYPELKDLQQGVPAFQAVAVMPTTLYGYGKVIQVGNQEPVQVESAPVSGEFFKVLGVHPILGRDFRDSDQHPGAARTVVLSNRVWRAQFQGDPGIVGRQIALNGEGYMVIGVMGGEVDFPRGVGLWLPLGLNKDLYNRSAYFLQAIARVKPGYSDEQVRKQVDALFKRLAREYPQFYSATQEALITPLARYWTGFARVELLVSLGASFVLLLSGCITASNLFLSRTLARQHEIATRSSVGATNVQIFIQFLAEGLSAALLAGSAGLAVAWAAIKLLVSIAPADIPRLEDAGINWPALACAVAASLAAGVACSVGPAFLAARLNLEAVLREGSPRLSGSRRGKRAQMGFIAAQAAISVILLVASLLIVDSIQTMLRTDTGFSHLDTVTMNLALRGPQADSAAKRHLLYTNLLNRLRDSPLVTNAGAVLVRPLEGTIGWDMTYRPEFDTAGPSKQLPVSNFEVITPGYFQTVGTPLLEGREFTDQDRENTAKVIIISKGLAQKMRSAGHEPVGTRVRLGRRNEGEWWTVVGVAANTRYRGVTVSDEDIYVCYLQTAIPVNYLVVRGRAPAGELAALVRKQVAALDSSQAVANVATIGELVRKNTARQRFNMTLLLSFGVAALFLTAAGVYSIIAEMVSLRTHEIAIRLALGADRVKLVRRLAGRTVGFVVIGEILGLLTALCLGRVLQGLLYGVQPRDPLIFTFALFCVLAVATGAAFIPAWIASGQNPRTLLR
jgi:putative ABC transport system permease protein